MALCVAYTTYMYTRACVCMRVCTKRYRMCIDKFFCTVPGDGGAATNRVRTEYIYVRSMRLQMCVYIPLYGVCVCVSLYLYIIIVVAAAASFSSCEQSMRFLRILNGVYVTNERLS